MGFDIMAKRGEYLTRSKLIDAGKLEKLLMAGLTHKQIAAYFSVSVQTLWRRRKDTHKQVAESVLDAQQAAILQAIGG